MKLMCLLSYITMCSSQEWITHNSFSYYFSNTNRSWTEAQTRCWNMSSNLASVTSVDASEFLNRTLGNKVVTGHWIGLHRLSADSCPCTTLPAPLHIPTVVPRTNNECELQNDYTCCDCRKKWTWSDGAHMSYMNWIPNEPTGGPRCGRIDSPAAAERPGYPDITIFSWFDVPCGEELRYICKRQVDPSTHISRMSDKQKQDDSLIIGVSVGLGLVLLIVVIVIVILLIRRRRNKPHSKQPNAESHYDEISAAEYVNQAAVTNDNHKPSPSSHPQYSTSYAHVILPDNKKPKPLAPKPAVEKEIKYADIDFGDSPVTHTQNGNEYSSAGSLYNQPHLNYDEDSLGYARTEVLPDVHMSKRTDEATHNNNSKPTPISPEQISAMYATPVKKNKAKKPDVLRKPAPNNSGVMYAMPVKK